MYDLIFHPDAEDEIYALEPVRQAKAIKGLEKLEAQGPALHYPDVDNVGRLLFELRTGKAHIIRTFFVRDAGERFFILRTYIKKNSKTPKREIALALSRWRDLEDDR